MNFKTVEMNAVVNFPICDKHLSSPGASSRENSGEPKEARVQQFYTKCHWNKTTFPTKNPDDQSQAEGKADPRSNGSSKPSTDSCHSETTHQSSKCRGG